MLTLLVALLTAQATPPAPQAAAPAAATAEAPMLSPFAEMRQALQDRDLPRFKAAFHPKAWDENFVGSSGLSGDSLSSQAKSDGWVLRPDPATLAQHAGAPVWVVRCDIVTLEDPDNVIDSVYAVVTTRKKGHVVLGTGEDLEQVNALALRAATGEELAPPE